MKVLLAVDQSQDAQVAARFLEAVRLPRGAALSIVHVIEIPHAAIRFPGQQIMLADWRKEAAADALGSILIVRGWPRGRQDRGTRVVLAMNFSKDAKGAAGFLSKLELPVASRVMLLYTEERADRVLAHISGMGRIDLSQAVEQAMRARKRRTLLMLERMGRRFAQQGLAVDHVFANGAPAEEILRAADRHRADLIVMGSKGLTGLDRFLIGSVSRKVARHAPCSVLVVRNRRR